MKKLVISSLSTKGYHNYFLNFFKETNLKISYYTQFLDRKYKKEGFEH